MHQYAPGGVYPGSSSEAIPAHLGAPWHSVEYVSLPPGDNGVGTHRQVTDEIHIILSGQGALVTNGTSTLVETGTLACAPAGTVHALNNRSMSEALTLLVVELETPGERKPAPSRVSMQRSLFQALREAEDQPSVSNRDGLVPILRAIVRLDKIFSPAWGTLSLLVFPSGCRTTPSSVETEQDQLWFLMRGHATWTIPVDEGSGEPIRLDSDDPDQPAQSVLVPAGIACGVTNKASGNYPLLMLRLTVHRPGQHTRVGAGASPRGEEAAPYS